MPRKSQKGLGLKCPSCGSLTGVERTEPSASGTWIQRTRKCLGCDRLFATRELPVGTQGCFRVPPPPPQRQDAPHGAYAIVDAAGGVRFLMPTPLAQSLPKQSTTHAVEAT
jgi:hypothetical protein